MTAPAHPTPLRIGLLLGLVLVGAGCVAERQGLSLGEAERVAWYAEDIAHGLPRSPTELQLVDGSLAIDHIARWAQGTVHDGQTVTHPPPLASRRARWSILAAGLAGGHILRTRDGLLRLAPDCDLEHRRLFADQIEQENLERLSTTALLLNRADTNQNTPVGRRLVASLAAARVAHDAAAGGELWQEPTPPSSTSPSRDAPIGSTSNQTPWREPGN